MTLLRHLHPSHRNLFRMLLPIEPAITFETGKLSLTTSTLPTNLNAGAAGYIIYVVSMEVDSVETPDLFTILTETL